MTPKQIKLIHIAVKNAGLDEAQYRVLLHNVAGVSSCKQLTQSGFEDVMATLEDLVDDGNRYWTRIVESRGRVANGRMTWKIGDLFDELQALDGRYALAGLVDRVSSGRTREPAKLAPREAWNLIEQLKVMIARARQEHAAASAPKQQELFVA